MQSHSWKIVLLIMLAAGGLVAVLGLFGNAGPQVSTANDSTDRQIDAAVGGRQLIADRRTAYSVSEAVDRARLVLQGTVMQPGRAIAFISIDDRPAKAVVIGEEIVPGLVLDNVTAQHVIIRHAQPLEKLSLSASKSSVYPQPVENKDSAETSGDDDQPADTRLYRLHNQLLGQQDPPQGINRVAPDQYIVSRDYLNQQLESPDLHKQMSIRHVDGKGFAFKSIQPGSMLDHLGMKMGDTVSGINDKPVNTLADAFTIRDELENTTMLSVTIERDNRTRHLYYFLN